MKLDNPWIMRLGGFGLTRLMRGWMGTLKYQIHREEPVARKKFRDPMGTGDEGGAREAESGSQRWALVGGALGDTVASRE